MPTILEMMLENCKKAGYYPTENIEKIARAKRRRCPCDGQNEKRYCISELCRSDIERDGICHCRCYQKVSGEDK